MKAIGLALVGIWLVAFVLAMSAVAGGSQPNGSGSRAGTATILLGDFQFSPNRIDAKVEAGFRGVLACPGHSGVRNCITHI